jgi:hypothetical protein
MRYYVARSERDCRVSMHDGDPSRPFGNSATNTPTDTFGLVRNAIDRELVCGIAQSADERAK